jgi:hypothetical protein
MEEDGSPSTNEIPEDVIEELKEAQKEIEAEIKSFTRRKKHFRYPTSRDIAEAVREAALSLSFIDPDEFPDLVREILKSKGYYTGLVTDKRIWRTYENLVRRGVIPDVLGVVT